jgi:adenosine deaminase
MEHYQAALKYKDMIIGIGLDSNEHNRPPALFEEVFSLARKDGFKLTAHCDVGVKDTHKHIRQVASTIANTGLDRMDHGLNVADDPDLVNLVAQRNLPMTICPWAYLRRETYSSIAERLRILLDAQIKVCISMDSGVYMDNTWITHNMLLSKRMCGLTDAEIFKIAKNSVEMSWAKPVVKEAITKEIEAMLATRSWDS